MNNMGSSEEYGSVPQPTVTTTSSSKVCAYGTAAFTSTAPMYHPGSTGPYVSAQTDALLTTTASYPTMVVSSLPLDRGHAGQCYQSDRTTPTEAKVGTVTSPPSPASSSSQRSAAGHYPSPRAKLCPNSRTEPSEERTINYEELKMKIAYKKFERECIMEFDGDTVLCRVCGDKASGFHYGVHACEGCKGFFRRSIQQKIQYRPCLKNQQCNIMRVNRNRCQYCRLKKCIAVGMSRDAVRFGRVPKKEKAKILEQMQKVNAQSQHVMLSSVLDTEPNLVQKIVDAHMKTCEYTRGKFAKFYEKAWANPKFINCHANMACPLNPALEEQDSDQWDNLTDCFTPAIRNVVNFAKCIPGFQVFSQEDQVTLLKAGTFEVLLVHLACLFDTASNTMMFANGKIYKRTTLTPSSNAGFLIDSMFDFAEHMNDLKLSDEETALFSALAIIAADRPGLRSVEHVERVQSRISAALHNLIKTNHPDDPAVFSKLLAKIPDLRTLNTLHSEKLLGLTVPNNAAAAEEEVTHKKNSIIPNGCPYTSNGSNNGSSFGLDGSPVMPQHVKCSQPQQQVVLQTSVGTFHHYSQSPLASTTSSPEPLEIDLPASKPYSCELSPPRLMPESHKRCLSSAGSGIRCKIPKLYNLWEYDMRSNRSNSLSSNSSLESTDSAYKSCPSTPRSTAPARTPEPTDIDPVLKQALAMPPLVAQHTWFHHPPPPPQLLELPIRRSPSPADDGSNSSSSSSWLPSPTGYPPHAAAAAAAAVMYQYNQLAAMQQYAALRLHSETSPLNLTTKTLAAVKSEPL